MVDVTRVQRHPRSPVSTVESLWSSPTRAAAICSRGSVASGIRSQWSDSSGIATDPPSCIARSTEKIVKDCPRRTAIFAARDLYDGAADYIRAVRTERYKYIRKFLPNRPHLQPNRY